ncbi:WD repeat-containing protein 75 [Venturia canescens]|uniref:WD repeat-containing protein 75 n=1 Tax=Venturia canescens TaxID=32260 RepID=UPI001C9C2970|nr:WD repeat-containing protein 75 [Venturia canescens]
MPPIPSKTTKPINSSVMDVDDLIVKRIGGGSIIDQRPLFSNDSEILYVVWKQVIRTYSTNTGDFVREFEPADNRITGIVHHSEDFNTIVGCTETGDLVNWNSQNGLVFKKLKLNIEKDVKISTFHIVNYTNPWGKPITQALVSYVTKNRNLINLVLLDLETGISTKYVTKELLCDEYHLDIIGNDGNNLVALVQDVDLHILDPGRNLAGKLHKIGSQGRKLTCVTGHPEEECVATGDSSGRVVVWKNLLATRPFQGVYHWHTLPVTEIAFSKSGGHMYTGGSECVLVKWTLANPHHKSFLPRLPAPIKHLTIAPENRYVAVSTLDNGIVVVNPQQKLTASIQNFTWGVTTSRKDLFPAGLILDPRTNSLVLNSRTGHVQFFDTNTKSLLYNVDITAQNLLPQERNVILVNTEVTKIALSPDGSWMATVEERDDKEYFIEIRLKFWKFDAQKQIFTLNTSIEFPHEVGVNALKFQPNSPLDDDDLFAVTVGKDKKFKLWNLFEPTSIHKNTKHWRCYSSGTYGEKPAMTAAFSFDGSVLGVTFKTSLTLWNPNTVTLKKTLTFCLYPHTLTHVEFGKHESCHLVVIASAKHLAVLDLLTLRMVWSVPLTLTNLVADPISDYMAAFTSDNSLFVFTPQSYNLVYEKNNVVDDDSFILGACFVPHPREKRDSTVKPWQRKSQLFFLDSNRELLTLESESEAAMSFENLTVNGNLPGTAFSNLIAGETSLPERAPPFIHEQLGSPGKGLLEKLLSVPAHTLPPLETLFVPLLMSFRTKRTDEKSGIQGDKVSSEMNGSQSRDPTNDSATEKDDDHDDKESSQSTTPTVNKEISDEWAKYEYERQQELRTDLVSYDWSFLASLFPE